MHSDLLGDEERISLCEVLDRVLNKGVVLHGDVMISVANVDLVYVALRLLVTSVETARSNHVRVPVRLGAGWSGEHDHGE